VANVALEVVVVVISLSVVMAAVHRLPATVELGELVEMVGTSLLATPSQQ
jgi:hypothetical protein